MNNFIKLCQWELLICNKVNNLAKFLSAFFLFAIFSIILINEYSDIKKFGIIFAIIYQPLSLMNYSLYVFKYDLKDGYLESIFTIFSSYEIIIAKYLTVLISALTSTILNLLIIFVIFNLNINEAINISIILFLLIMPTCALVMLIGTIQIYFRANTDFLSIIIMPLLIPNIILSGLLIQNFYNFYLCLVLGINCILIPFSLFLAAILLKNIYNN